MMKRGAKRPALDSTGPDLRSRRVMDAASFGAHRPAPAEAPAAHPGIDPRRAESSRIHVTALNRQFASWVEFQLQNHPDELWEDGVKDYLNHASHIMENFKDVVDWLRANAAESSGMSTIVSRANAAESSGMSTTVSRANAADTSGISTTKSPIEQNNLVVVSDKNISDTNSASAQPSTSASSPSLLTSGSLFSAQSSSSLFSQSTSSLFSSSQSLGSGFGSQSSASSLFSSQSSGSSLFSSQSSASSLFSSQNSTSSLFSFQSSAPSLFGSQSTGSLFGFQTSGSLFGSQSQGSLFSPQSLSLFSSSQTPSFPVSSGTQNPSLEVEASDDIGGEDEPEEPSSPSLKKAEEKGIVVVHEVKCKVYQKPDDPADRGWKDMGVGQLSIKCKEGASKATKESTPTIVIRNDVGKILLNALIYSGIKLNIQNKTIASIFHTSIGDGADSSKSVARMYLFRMKNLEDTTKLAKTIEEHVPSG